MNDELERIIKINANLDNYLKKYSNNSLFLYNYYLQNTSRILTNFYAYGGYLKISDKIKLVYKLLESDINYEMLNYLLTDINNYYLEGKNKKDITTLYKYLLNLDKEKKIDLSLIGIKSDIYKLNPLYALNKDFNEINNISVTDKDTLIKILKLSIKKKYTFTGRNSVFLEYTLFDNKEVLIYFINNCNYDDYCIGLITGYFDTLDKKELYDIYKELKDCDIKDFLSSSLNFDNYDADTIAPDSNLYLMVEEHPGETIDLLYQIKEKGLKNNIILIVDRVDLVFINEAYSILGEQIKVSPLMNQEHMKVFDGPWDFPYYSVEEIRNSEKTLDLYAKTVDDKVDKDGNIKSLSPFEKFIAAYILTTKFYPYTEEDDEQKEYHTSRGVYEFIDKTQNRKIVCVGYVHLLRELLFRMGIYDTLRWDVHSEEEEKRNNNPGDNHARMLIHLVDPKYNIDGVYMSDPTWDEMGIFVTYIKHMLMSKDEVCKIDPEFSIQDLHLDRVDEIEDYLEVPDLNKLFNKPIDKETIIKGFINVYRFLDKNMKMDDEISNMEYHEMAIRLGFESKYDDGRMPTFSELIILKRDALDYYFELYPNLKLSYYTELRDDLKRYVKGNGVNLPIRITTKGIIVDLSIKAPYLKYLEDSGYHIRYTKDKACIDVYSYTDDPIIWQYSKIIDKLVEFNAVIYNITSGNEKKGLK